MNTKNKLRLLIRQKLLNEVLDWHPSQSEPENQTFEVSPARMTRTIEIEGVKMIISILFDNHSDSAHVSFVEQGKSFSDLTGANSVGKVLSTACMQAIEMIENYNDRIFGKGQFRIDTFIFTPAKLAGEEKLKPLQTKRGKIYSIFMQRYFKIHSLKENGEDILVTLKWPIIVGKNSTINRKNFLRTAA